MTGPNKVIRYDTTTNSVAYTVDLAPFVSQVPELNGTIPAGGFQDFASDAQGTTYVPTVFHTPSIAKITTAGDLSVWYAGTPVETGTEAYIYLGIIYHAATEKLIVTAPYMATFVSFDTTSASPAPTNLTMTGRPADGSYPGLECDGLIAPARYGTNVLLCSENGLGDNGAITLWATTDGYASVEYIGKVDNNSTLVAGYGSPTATVQLTDAIFISNEFFHDTGAFDVVGTRSSFPFIDATADFDAVVSAAGFPIDTSS